MTEKLVAAAIIRNGKIESNGLKAHWRIRLVLGDENPTRSQLTDQEGFLTSTGRFVDRYEARRVGVESGQLSPKWETNEHPLFSVDVDW